MLGIHAIDTFISTIIYVTNSIYNPPFKKNLGIIKKLHFQIRIIFFVLYFELNLDIF